MNELSCSRPYKDLRFAHSNRFAPLLLLLWIIALMVYSQFPPAAYAAELSLEPVLSGLDRPVSIAQAGDGSGRLFVSLQGGKLVIVKGDRVLAKPFLDLSKEVSCCGERGLLGVAFHPDYRKNGLFFVNYTDRKGDTTIARYKVSADPDVADHASAAVILKIDQPFPNHNGGQLQFGPDRFLYIGMGDGGSGGDPGNRAQNRGVLLGKLLRIDVDGGTPYGIPPGNPFVGRPGMRPEIWAFGLRNPWRFSFDRGTGDLYIADVGQDRVEEIDYQPASSKGGENYGWKMMEGTRCFDPAKDCDGGTLVLPIAEYQHAEGCSVIGGYVYRGLKIPALQGTYLYADYCSGRIWGTKRDPNGKWQTRQVTKTDLQITSFGEAEDGELYLCELKKGGLYRVSGF